MEEVDLKIEQVLETLKDKMTNIYVFNVEKGTYDSITKNLMYVNDSKTTYEILKSLDNFIKLNKSTENSSLLLFNNYNEIIELVKQEDKDFAEEFDKNFMQIWFNGQMKNINILLFK